ncbi:hypothetical protein Droror1_Dr00014178 [Drosera rotundifolia]
MATSPASLKVFSSRTNNLLTLAKHLLPFPTTTTTIAAATIKPLLDHPPLHFPIRTHQDDLLFQVTQVIGGGGKEGKGAAIVEARGRVDDDDEGGAMSDNDAVEWDESEDHEDEDEDDFDFDEDDVNVEENRKKKLK